MTRSRRSARSAYGAVPPRLLERLLRLFTEVRPGEAELAGSMFATVFLILASYYLLKPVRDGLLAGTTIHSLSDLQLKAYSNVAQAVVLLVAIPVYGRLTRRWPRGLLLTRVNAFFASNLLLFWALQPGLLIAGTELIAIVFYVWVGIFGLFVVAQFWGFAADIYTDERGKRIFPVIALGASAGATAGAWSAAQLVRYEAVGTHGLLPAAAACLAFSTFLIRRIDLAHLGPERIVPQRRNVAAPGAAGALRLIGNSRYLLATAFMIVMVNWVNTNGENVLFGFVQYNMERQVEAHGLRDAAEVQRFVQDGTTAFYGDFLFWVSLTGLVLQGFLASRVLKYGGFGVLLMILPVVAMVSYSTMALIPVLALVKTMKIAENATNYSLQNTAQHVLWLPTTAAMKYRAKSAIDTVVVRFGDLLAGATVFAGSLLQLALTQYLLINMALILFWIAIARTVIQENRRLIDERETPPEPPRRWPKAQMAQLPAAR